MLVDNGIVVAEDIRTRMELGPPVAKRLCWPDNPSPSPC